MERESGSLVNVICIPIATLLTALDVSHVDLFVVDVEGSEWGVLNSFPFHQITVDVSINHLSHSCHIAADMSTSHLRTLFHQTYITVYSIQACM